MEPEQYSNWGDEEDRTEDVTWIKVKNSKII